MRSLNFLNSFFMILMLVCVTQAQTITENKVSFQYTQLPYVFVDQKFLTYEVKLNPVFEKANEDSLQLYNANRELARRNYEAAFDNWKEQKKAIEKDYLMKMADYQKKTNAGKEVVLPVPPVYPLPPFLNLNDEPVLHESFSEDNVSAKINLQGYQKGKNGAVLTIGLFPLSDLKMHMNVTGTKSSTRYQVTFSYRLPVEVSFKGDNQLIYQETLLMDECSYSLKDYDSQYDFQLWWMDNKESFVHQLEQQARNNALDSANARLNDILSFQKLKRDAVIFTVKKYKKYNYDDMQSAYQQSAKALSMVVNDNKHQQAIPELDKAIELWKKILEEGKADSTTRINSKITAMIYANLAELAVWKGDFNEAETYLNLIKNLKVYKFKLYAENQEAFYEDQKKRWESQLN